MCFFAVNIMVVCSMLTGMLALHLVEKDGLGMFGMITAGCTPAMHTVCHTHKEPCVVRLCDGAHLCL